MKYRTDRKTGAGKAQRYHTDPEINLYAAYPIPRLFPGQF